MKSPMAIVLALAASCGGTKPEPELSPPQGRCQSLSGPSPLTLPELPSRLGIEVVVEQSLVEQELSRNVPYTLASAKNQSVGAPGKVTYKVNREGFRVGATQEGIEVTTRLLGDIDVCKPVGPFCVAYGSCDPRWAVNVKVPTDFDQDLSLRVRTSVDVTKGCVLRPVGYDATSEIERITRQQVRGVRQRIRSELGRIERQIETGWRRLHEPIALADGTCLQLRVDGLQYRPVQAHQGQLTTAIAASGALALGCTPEAPEDAGAVGVSRSSSGGPRVKAQADLVPAIDLAVGYEWPLDAVRAALTRALGRDVELEVVGGSDGGPNRLFVNLAAGSACPKWVHVTPTLNAHRLSLRPSTSEAEALPAVAAPIAYTQLGPAVDQLEKRLREGIAQSEYDGVELQVDKRLEHGVEVSPASLRLVARLRGNAALRAPSQ